MARTRKIAGWNKKLNELGDLKYIARNDPRLLILKMTSSELGDEHLGFINLMMEKLDELGHLGMVESDNPELLKILTMLEDKKREPKPKPSKRRRPANAMKLNVDYVEWLLETRGHTRQSFGDLVGKSATWVSLILLSGLIGPSQAAEFSKGLGVPVDRLVLEGVAG